MQFRSRPRRHVGKQLPAGLASQAALGPCSVMVECPGGWAMNRSISVEGRSHLRGGLLVSWFVGFLPPAGTCRVHPPGRMDGRAPTWRVAISHGGPRSVVAVISA